MVDWRRLPVPQFCERLIGFSVPENGEILVVSYEGVHLLRLGPQITVETDNEYAEHDIYDPVTGVASYRGKEYRIIGLHGGSPLVEGPDGERLVLDTDSETLSVVRGGKMVYSTAYENFSGDWAAATFSQDGRYIVLGAPYDFDFIVLERPSGGCAG